MLVATTENVPGYRRAKTYGQVFGLVVRSRGIGGNIIASLRTIVGGSTNTPSSWKRRAARPSTA